LPDFGLTRFFYFILEGIHAHNIGPCRIIAQMSGASGSTCTNVG